MSEPDSRRGRLRNAERAREIILDAAEVVFAEHGFAGARVDAIAAEAGYNKSLIFQYFGDKLGLYTEMLKRVDRQAAETEGLTFNLILSDRTIASDTYKFRTFLETTIRSIFDFLGAHPRYARINAWEEAEGWQTYAKVISQFDHSDIEQVVVLFKQAREAGIIRPGLDPILILHFILNLCMSSQAALARYQMLVKEVDFASPAAFLRTREQVIDFLVHGIMLDPPETKP